jgi:hypothetical protein
MLIWDDGPAAEKIVIEGSLDIEDIVNIGKNNKSYWIIVVKPEQKCRVLGRCKFWLCPVTSSDIPSGDTGISGWSEWVWDARRRQYGRYRVFRGVYEYDWQDPEPSASSTSQGQRR